MHDVSICDRPGVRGQDVEEEPLAMLCDLPLNPRSILCISGLWGLHIKTVAIPLVIDYSYSTCDFNSNNSANAISFVSYNYINNPI